MLSNPVFPYNNETIHQKQCPSKEQTSVNVGAAVPFSTRPSLI